MPKFKKGAPRPEGSGRKPGSRNKIQLAAKEAIGAALNHGRGAVAWLVRMRDSRVAADRAAFAHLVGRLVPREINADIDVDTRGRVITYVLVPDNGRGPTAPTDAGDGGDK